MLTLFHSADRGPRRPLRVITSCALQGRCALIVPRLHLSIQLLMMKATQSYIQRDSRWVTSFSDPTLLTLTNTPHDGQSNVGICLRKHHHVTEPHFQRSVLMTLCTERSEFLTRSRGPGSGSKPGVRAGPLSPSAPHHFST